MPNNFTAVGLDWDLKETTLKDDNNDEMPAHCMHAACMLYIFAWDIVGCMILSTQIDGCQTYVKLGGFLQYLLYYKSGVVGVLLFPGRIMEDIGKLNSHFIHKVIKIYKYKKCPT